MADQQQLSLGRLLELTDLMLARALDQQWESVRELQVLRDSLIRDFYNEEIILDDQCVVRAINHIIESDQKLARLGLEERSLLQAQIYKLKHGRSAVKAYTG